MVRTKESVAEIIAQPGTTRPILRRDTHTTLLKLNKQEALELIGEITKFFDGGVYEKIYLVIEGGEIFSKEVD